MARDLGGPDILAQILICPMLDHRNDTVSARQYAGRPRRVDAGKERVRLAVGSR